MVAKAAKCCWSPLKDTPTTPSVHRQLKRTRTRVVIQFCLCLCDKNTTLTCSESHKALHTFMKKSVNSIKFYLIVEVYGARLHGLEQPDFVNERDQDDRLPLHLLPIQISLKVHGVEVLHWGILVHYETLK